MSEHARESTSHANRRETTEFSPHQRSVIQMSPRCLNERGDRDVCFVGGVEAEMNHFPAFKPTHLTRGRKHVGPTSPGSCEKKKEKKKQSVKLRHKQGEKTAGDV